MKTLGYSLVIATCGRPSELERTLADLAAQTRRPERVVVADATPSPNCGDIVRHFRGRLPVEHLEVGKPSAAGQRNTGAEEVTTPLIVFMDDDVALPPDLFGRLCAPFDTDEEGKIGGIAARIRGMQHSKPGRWLRAYYRLQAGFDHPTFGGKLFGPAINCLPTYEEEGGDLIPADWLHSTCVCYRIEPFLRERFPDFAGYSFLEDVHLSSRIARTHRLYFHKSALFEHLDAPSRFKRDFFGLARVRVKNQERVAREIMGLSGSRLRARLTLHKLFVSVALLRRGGPGAFKELMGTWI